MILEKTPLLEVCELTKKYKKKPKPAIDKVSFKVFPGEFHAFIGANGAGKTTTIKSIVGAYSNYLGSIYINGINNKNPESRNKMGYIPEIAKFPSRISSYDYLMFMCALNNMSKIDSENFVKKIMMEMNIWNLKDQSPNNFSSGQKKKILLAQALANDPSILIMDEPAANLDPKARIDFFNTLKKLQKEGKSIFISSHILSELDYYADSLTILDNGKIALTGKRNELFNDSNLFSYKIKVDKSAKNLSFLRKYKINSDGEFICEFKKKDGVFSLLKKIIDKNALINFSEYKLSIEELYKKFVVFGSVDTK